MDLSCELLVTCLNLYILLFVIVDELVSGLKVSLNFLTLVERRYISDAITDSVMFVDCLTL